MTMNSTAFRFTIFLVSFYFGVSANSQVVYVDPSASGTGDGASWTNAVTDLQSGIDLAATVASSTNPIQVWIKEGTYYPTTGTSRSARFELKSYVELYGGFIGTESSLGQRDIRTNESILSGDIGMLSDNSDNSYAIFTLGATFEGPIILDGLKISDTNDASGVESQGIFAVTTGANPSLGQFTNCTFYGNNSTFGSVWGFYNWPATFQSCIFENNGSTGVNVTLWSTSSLDIINSVFVGNYTPVNVQVGTLSIINSTFYNNTGDAVNIQDQPTPIVSSLYNNIFWQNAGTDILAPGGASANLTAANNLVEDPFTSGTNTIIGDPQFVGVTNGDLSITHCSPAVDQGDNTQISSITEDLNGNPRVFNSNVDLGAYENQLTPIFFSAVEIGNTTCNGSADGQISVNAGGGNGNPIMYSVDGANFSSNGTFPGLAAGNYNIYATDGSCTYSETFTVDEPDRIEINISVSQGATSLEVNLVATGGAGLYQYSTDGTNFQSSGTFPVAPGELTVYARDANNCMESRGITISASGRLVVYVDPAAAGTSTGDTWRNAYLDLQTAIDAGGAASSSTNQIEIWVKSGTYYPDLQTSTDRTQTIAMRNYVYVMGGFDGTETTFAQRDVKNNVTILSGDIGVPNDSTDNSYGIVSVGTDVSNEAQLDGFRIEGAHALSVTTTNGAISLVGDVGHFYIKNCIFVNNLANEGACIRTAGVTNTTSEVTIESSTFFNNGFYATSGYIGSAIYAKNQVMVYNSLFIRNKSGLGGVFYLIDGQIEAINNTFYENSAGNGSLIFSSDTDAQTHATLHNNIVWANLSPSGRVYGVALTDQLTATHNLSQVNVTGSNNILDDPQFVDESTYDLKLKYCSPAVDAGDDSVLPVGLLVDLSENSRQVNTIDIGAYENQITPITITLVSQEDVNCNGQANGSIEIAATGGEGVLEYSIDGTNFSSNPFFTGLSAGSYTVIVSDTGNGCQKTQMYTIEEPDEIVITADAFDITCNGQSDGIISGSITGGTSPYQVYIDGTLIETGITSGFSVGNLIAGTYIVSIMDDNGCNVNFSSSLTISEPSVLSAVVTKTDVLCNGEATGELTVTVSGGTGPYQYSIDGINFQSSNVFTSLPAGSYTIEVHDASNCSVTSSDIITEPLSLVAGLDFFTHPSCEGVSDGELDAEASGGTAPYSYSLDGVNFSTSGIFQNLPAGSYTVTVRDDNGCESQISQGLTNQFTLSATVSANDPLCNGESNGEITLSVSGGTAPYDYLISGTSSSQTSPTFSGLAAGTYVLRAIDANGCQAGTTIDLIDPDALVAQLNPTNVTCNGLSDGSISVAASGGTSPYEFSIDGVNFQSSSEFDALDNGTYTVTVRDMNGCIEVGETTIYEPDILVSTIVVTDNVCFDGVEGSIVVSSSGGTSPYSYSIDGTTFQSSESFTGLVAGNYSLTIEDSQGCREELDASVMEPDELTISVVQDERSFMVTASGGTSPYEYSQDGMTFQASGSFNELDPGSYVFNVRDANGCIEESSQFDIVLGLDNPTISVYPNPAHELIEITGIAFDHILIYNLEGRVVKQSNIGIISVDELSRGVHIMKVISNGKEVHHQKLIIN